MVPEAGHEPDRVAARARATPNCRGKLGLQEQQRAQASHVVLRACGVNANRAEHVASRVMELLPLRDLQAPRLVPTCKAPVRPNSLKRPLLSTKLFWE